VARSPHGCPHCELSHVLAEAIGERALKLKQLATQLGEMKGQVNVLGLLSKGSLTLETLQEPHKSMAKRLSTTRIMAAISAGQGSAMALVSRGEGYMSIDLIATNPSYMVASETAELALLEAVVAEAAQAGASEVKLSPAFQVGGDTFYSIAGFLPAEGAPPEPTDDRARVVDKSRVLYRRIS